MRLGARRLCSKTSYFFHFPSVSSVYHHFIFLLWLMLTFRETSVLFQLVVSSEKWTSPFSSVRNDRYVSSSLTSTVSLLRGDSLLWQNCGEGEEVNTLLCHTLRHYQCLTLIISIIRLHQPFQLSDRLERSK